MSVNTFVWVSIKKDDAAQKVVIIFYETLTWNENAQTWKIYNWWFLCFLQIKCFAASVLNWFDLTQHLPTLGTCLDLFSTKRLNRQSYYRKNLNVLLPSSILFVVNMCGYIDMLNMFAYWPECFYPDFHREAQDTQWRDPEGPGCSRCRSPGRTWSPETGRTWSPEPWYCSLEFSHHMPCGWFQWTGVFVHLSNGCSHIPQIYSSCFAHFGKKAKWWRSRTCA